MTERARISSEHRAKRNQLAPENPSTGSRKRDTKRWCRGKSGVKHDYRAYEKVHDLGWSADGRRHIVFSLRYAKCANCGREEWGDDKVKKLLS